MRPPSVPSARPSTNPGERPARDRARGGPPVRWAPALALALALAAHSGAAAQPDPTLLPDSAELHRDARDAQSRFERLRLRWIPRGEVRSGGGCDERVGRFCAWYDEGEWTPEPEAPELTALRGELLAALDSVGERLPGDAWVVGQRVWYHLEAGDEAAAAASARACRGEVWWCHALAGLVLHHEGRFVEADSAFEAALGTMDPREARSWRLPERAVDGEARSLLEAAGRDGEGEDPGPVLERFWLLADPLWLVPGNDRRTAHYARWTVSMIRVGARTPHGISWGRDMEELTVRHGWELGWTRGWREPGAETPVAGQKHPEGRDYLPAGPVLRDPASASPEETVAGTRRPRSLYAPAYAPLLLPMDAQVAVFPRGDRVAVVASHHLPPDTTRHRDHDHPRPWLEPGEQAGLPERAGLFLVPAGSPLAVEDGVPTGGGAVGGGDSGGGTPRSAEIRWDGGARAGAADSSGPGAPASGLLVEVPGGRWIVSVERWSPERRRAGRLRRGLDWPGTPPDVATLSDLLLVAAGGGEPAGLAEAAARALPRPSVLTGESFGVVWEEGGLGWTPERLRYTLFLRKEGGHLLRRVGRWLGVVGEEEPLRLAWEEDGPGTPGPRLRHLEVDPGRLEPGAYRLVLEVEATGRGTLRSELVVRVAEDHGGAAR